MLKVFILVSTLNLWFWLLLGAEIVFLLFATAWDSLSKANWSIFWVFVILLLFGDIHTIEPWIYLKTHWQHMLMYTGIYLVVGIGWSLVKWYWLNRDLINAYKSLRLQQREATSPKGWPAYFREEWQEHLVACDICCDSREYVDHYSTSGKLTNESSEADVLLAARPQPNRFKSRIAFWVCYWPASFCWSVLHDFLQRIWDEIFACIKMVYESISNRVFRV